MLITSATTPGPDQKRPKLEADDRRQRRGPPAEVVTHRHDVPSGHGFGGGEVYRPQERLAISGRRRLELMTTLSSFDIASMPWHAVYYLPTHLAGIGNVSIFHRPLGFRDVGARTVVIRLCPNTAGGYDAVKP